MAYKKIGEIKDLSEIGGNNRTALASFLNLGINGQSGTYKLYKFRDEDTLTDIIFPDAYIVISSYTDYVKSKNHDGSKKVTLGGVEYSLYLPNLDELKVMLSVYSEDETARNMSNVADNSSVRTMTKRNFNVENRALSMPTYIIPLLKGNSNNAPMFKDLDNIDYGKIAHKPDSITFTVSDPDVNDTVTLLINVNGDTVDSITSENNTLTHTYDFGFFDNANYGKHSVDFVVMDSKGVAISKTITLEKIKESIQHIPEDTTLIDSSVALYSIENELEYQCNKLEDLLKGNNIAIEPSQKNLNSLIDKVVEKGLGARSTHGSVNSSTSSIRFNHLGGGSTAFFYVDIPKSELNFIPRFIFCSRFNVDTEYLTVYKIGMNSNNYVLPNRISVDTLKSNGISDYGFNIKIDEIVQLEDAYRLPVSNTGNYEWFAIELKE